MISIYPIRWPITLVALVVALPTLATLIMIGDYILRDGK